MSNIDKQAFRPDGGDIGSGRIREIADNPYGDEEKCWLAKRVLVLLDEVEIAEKRIADQSGIIESARKFISEYAGLGDVGAAEFIKIIDRATAAGKGDAS